MKFLHTLDGRVVTEIIQRPNDNIINHLIEKYNEQRGISDKQRTGDESK